MRVESREWEEVEIVKTVCLCLFDWVLGWFSSITSDKPICLYSACLVGLWLHCEDDNIWTPFNWISGYDCIKSKRDSVLYKMGCYTNRIETLLVLKWVTTLEDIYRYIVGDIYRNIVGDINRYIVGDIYRYIVAYLKIQGRGYLQIHING